MQTSTETGTSLFRDVRLRNGEYVIESVLGIGGFGITYRAYDTALDRPVAIKELFPTGCGRNGTAISAGGGWTAQMLSDYKRRFIDEGRVLARLRHPGIVQIYTIFEENGTAYLVMEFIEGQSVQSYLDSRTESLPVADALDVTRQVGEALKVVHAAGLLHRDLKPSNIMRRPDGSVVLIDFGAARDFVPDSPLSHTVIFTPGYAPIEQLSRDGKRGPFTDVYALAATLYHMLTGRVPTDATARVDGMALPKPHDLRQGVPNAVSDGVMAGLQISSGDRPATAEAFMTLLTADSSPSSPTIKPTTKGRFNRVAKDPETNINKGQFLIPQGHRLEFIFSFVLSAAFIQAWLHGLALRMLYLTYCWNENLGRANELAKKHNDSPHDLIRALYSPYLWWQHEYILNVTISECVIAMGFAVVQWLAFRKLIKVPWWWIIATVGSWIIGANVEMAAERWEIPDFYGLTPIWLYAVIANCVGVIQWFILREYVRTAWLWIGATIGGILLGSSLMFAIIDQSFYSPTHDYWHYCVAAGAVYGAVLTLIQALCLLFMRKKEEQV